MTQRRLRNVREIKRKRGKCAKEDVVSVDRFRFQGRKMRSDVHILRERNSTPLFLLSMPLDLELTRLDSSTPPPPELRAGASVSVDTSTGRVSLGGAAFATLSAEDVAKVSSSSSTFSNPSPATVRTIRREKDSSIISSVTIRLIEVSSSAQARPPYQHHHHQQPRRGEGCLILLLALSIDRSMAFWQNLNFLNLLLLNLKPSPSLHTQPAFGPPPSSTLDPDELACRLTKGQLDALASSSEVLEALKNQDTRAAVTRALAAADGPSSNSAAAALESEGAQLAGLATAVLDCLERHDEEEEKK